MWGGLGGRHRSVGGPGWKGGTRFPEMMPMCVCRMLMCAEPIRLLVSSGQRQSKEGLVSLCSEAAGEHGWKTQLSVGLEAGRKVRACLPALPLGAERLALLSVAAGAGCIDQGQRWCVIKGGPGIKGILPKASRMAQRNPRQFTPFLKLRCAGDSRSLEFLPQNLQENVA